MSQLIVIMILTSMLKCSRALVSSSFSKSFIRNRWSTLSRSYSINGAPPEPINYGKDFYLMRPETPFPLEEINKHPLDGEISFEEDSHTYFVNKFPVKYSVTQIVGDYFEKFVPDVAIERMIGGPRWPRPEYQHKATGEPFTPEEIKRQWDSIGEYARNRGTWMHYNIERHLNDMQPSDNLIEFKQFLDFERDFMKTRGVVPYRTEWRIADPDYNLAGSVDFVGALPDGTYCLMDWKRSKNLATSMSNTYGRRGRYPIDHLDDCEATKYFLQLNLYRYIIQKRYGLTISSMILTSFHPQASSGYFMTETPIWEEEVEKVLEDVVKRSENGNGEQELNF